jgi:hypothetical protein
MIGIPLLAAAKGHFVEFNRNLPIPTDIDGAAFPLSSTVHGDDPETVSENIPAVSDMVQTARRLTGKSMVSISPLALYWPPSEGEKRFPSALVEPWLSGVISFAASAGVSSITLADDVVDAIAAAGEGSPRKLTREN